MAPKSNNGVGVRVEDTKICVVMVGLPARGKSYIAQIGRASKLQHIFDPIPIRCYFRASSKLHSVSSRLAIRC